MDHGAFVLIISNIDQTINDDNCQFRGLRILFERELENVRTRERTKYKPETVTMGFPVLRSTSLRFSGIFVITARSSDNIGMLAISITNNNSYSINDENSAIIVKCLIYFRTCDNCIARTTAIWKFEHGLMTEF